MLQSSYRWDGLNFENICFALKLSPLMKKLTVSVSEACQLLKYINIQCMGKVARYKEKYTRQHQKVVPCHCQSLQQRFREDCPCLQLYLATGVYELLLAIFRANQLTQEKA